MRTHCLILALIVSLGLVGVGRAFDSVKTVSKGKLSGRITGMDSTKIDLEQGLGGVLQEVPVNEIQAVDYEGEPADLKAAKKHVLDGHYAEALAALERIKEKPVRREMQQDVEFYKALCSARLALGGSMKIVEAGRMMKGFADANPKSYHYLEAVRDDWRLVGGHPPVRRRRRNTTRGWTTPLGPTTRCGRAWTPAGHFGAGQGPRGGRPVRQGVGYRGRGGFCAAQRTAASAGEGQRPGGPEKTRRGHRHRRKDHPERRSRGRAADGPRLQRPGNGPTTGRPRQGGPAGVFARRYPLLFRARRPTPRRWPIWPSYGSKSTRPTAPIAPAKRSKNCTRTALGRRRNSSPHAPRAGPAYGDGTRSVPPTFRPAGETSCGPLSAAWGRRGCRSGWWRCWRGRAFLGLGGDRRRRPTGGWRNCAARCAG